MTMKYKFVISLLSLAVFGLALIYPAKVIAAAVIFRMDDVQDFYASAGTKAVMDLFQSQKIPLTIGIIANHIGNDSAVTNKTAQGIKAGIFEVALHGLEHVDYKTLSPTMQSVTITQGNTILKKLFNVHPFIFIPPYDSYNAATVAAVASHDMNIISSDLGSESAQHTKDQIFNATVPCGTTDSGVICQGVPIHLSAGESFRMIRHNDIVQHTNEQLLANIADNIKHYGYSLLIVHPQDFVFTNPQTGKITANKVNPTAMGQLTMLVNQIKAIPAYKPSTMADMVASTRPGV